MLRTPPLKRHLARASNTLSFGFQIYYQAALHKTLVSSLSGRFGFTPRVGWGDQLGGPMSGPLQDKPIRNTVSTGQDLREEAEVSSPAGDDRSVPGAAGLFLTRRGRGQQGRGQLAWPPFSCAGHLQGIAFALSLCPAWALPGVGLAGAPSRRVQLQVW